MHGFSVSKRNHAEHSWSVFPGYRNLSPKANTSILLFLAAKRCADDLGAPFALDVWSLAQNLFLKISRRFHAPLPNVTSNLLSFHFLCTGIGMMDEILRQHPTLSRATRRLVADNVSICQKRRIPKSPGSIERIVAPRMRVFVMRRFPPRGIHRASRRAGLRDRPSGRRGSCGGSCSCRSPLAPRWESRARR